MSEAIVRIQESGYNSPDLLSDIAGHHCVHEDAKKAVAQLVYSLNVDSGQLFPTLRLLPKELRHQIGVKIADKLGATAAVKHFSDPIQRISLGELLLFVQSLPGSLGPSLNRL